MTDDEPNYNDDGVEPFDDFDEFVSVIRIRLRDADAIEYGRLHQFREHLTSEAEHAVIPDNWYWEAFDELEAQGHLDPASSRLNGGDAMAGLSADGRYYLRHGDDV
jgi:hypothetical protein